MDIKRSTKGKYQEGHRGAQAEGQHRISEDNQGQEEASQAPAYHVLGGLHVAHVGYLQDDKGERTEPHHRSQRGAVDGQAAGGQQGRLREQDNHGYPDTIHGNG